MPLKAVIESMDYTNDISSDGGNYGYSIRYTPRTSGEAFTSIDSVEYDNKIGYKAMVSLTFDPMEEDRASTLLQLLLNKKYITLTYDDPGLGKNRTIEAKLGEIPTQIVLMDLDGEIYWGGISITLTER